MILPISSRKTLPAHASVRPRISSWSVLKTWNTNSTWERVWKTSQTLHFVFEHESREWNLERERNLEREWSERKLEREWSEQSESYVTFVTNETNETNVTNVTNVRNVKQEMAIGGDATRHSCAPLQKSNNFEPFFSDSTLTFLTFGNTFRLPILPTRRVIFLCLPLIKIWGRQRKIRGRQILPGSAPKNPVFKGKVTKKGGSRGSSHISIQI